MTACQVCISVFLFLLWSIILLQIQRISVLTNRVHLTNQFRQLESIHQILRLMKWSGKQSRKLRSRKRGHKNTKTKTATEGILAFQMEQFNYQKEQDQKFETMLRNTFEQQRQMDAEERQIDRDFFLKLGKTFSRSKKLFSASELQYIIAIRCTEIRCPKEIQEPNLYRYKRLASYISLDVLKLYLWCVYKTQNRFV